MYNFVCLQLGTEMLEYNKAKNRNVQYVEGCEIMEKLFRKTTVLFAFLIVAVFSLCTVYAEDNTKFAPGIAGVEVNMSGTECTASLTIADSAKLSGDVVLVAASFEKETGRIATIDTAIYQKDITVENTISATVSVSQTEEFKYFLLNSGGGTQKNYPPVAPATLKATVLPNSLELSWDKANDDFDSLTKYIIKADNEMLGEVDGDKTTYTVENLKADESHDFEVIAVDDAGHQSTAAELSQVFPVSNTPVSSTFDLSIDATDATDVVYTDSELKIGKKSNAWAIVDKDMWFNNSGSEGQYVEKELGENVFKITRGNEKYFVVIFGENTKKSDTVNVSFDMWGSYRWQNGTVIYNDSSDTKQEKVESIGFDNWKNFSYTMKTDFDLTDYGYAGECGFVIVYKGSGTDYLWVKNLQVKNTGFAVGITADATGTNYGTEMLPCGNELSGTNGNAISGQVHRDGSYGVGYQYKNVNGVDAFYLTQMYDTNASGSVDVTKGYMGFKVDTDKFPKSPSPAKNIYLITEYYDGTVGDIQTKPFEISYTARSYNWANSSGTNVPMLNDNTWKTHIMQLSDVYFGVSNNADSAAITYRLPNSNNGYNKCGILIRRVMIVDEGFYQKYLAN